MAFPPARRPPSVPRKSLVTGPGHSLSTCRAPQHQTGALCCSSLLVQVAVGAEEPQAAGSAGRELGEPRLGLVELVQHQTTSRASGTRGTLTRVRGGGRGQAAVSGKPIGERCRADSPGILTYLSRKLESAFADRAILKAPLECQNFH